MSFEYYDRRSENSPLDQELASLDESENSFDVITVGRKEEDRLRFRYLNLAESSMPELRGNRGPLWVIDEFQRLTKNTFRHEIIWYIGEGLYQRWWFVPKVVVCFGRIQTASNTKHLKTVASGKRGACAGGKLCFT